MPSGLYRKHVRRKIDEKKAAATDRKNAKRERYHALQMERQNMQAKNEE